MFFAAPESIKTNRMIVAIYYGEMPTKADENARPATPPEFIKPVGCAGGRGGLHCLSFVQACGG
jgi:hypothetical protein